MRLKQRVAIVTGGSRGIGRAIATALAREGAHVVIASRDVSRATEACHALEALGVRALPVSTDVSRLADIEAMQQRVLAVFDRIDILVNNAGLGAGPPALELSEGEWDRILG